MRNRNSRHIVDSFSPCLRQQILWIDLEDLEQSDFMPKAIIPYLKKIAEIQETVVMGDVN